MHHTNEAPSGRFEIGWRSWHGLPIFLIALNAVLSWLARGLGLAVREDDVRYLMLASSLKRGMYREIWMPGSPPHHMYPPGYPALLAVWTAIGGHAFGWLVLLQIVFSAATLAFTFDVVRRIAGPPVAVGTLCILAVNPTFIEASGQLMSEAPLALCFAIAIWGSVVLPRGRRQSALLLSIAAIAPLVRIVGVALPIAVIVHWLMARRYRDALLATAIFAAVLGPLFAWTMSDPVVVVGSSYAADLLHTAARLTRSQTIVNRVFRNSYFYLIEGIPVTLPAPAIAGTLLDNVLVTAIVVVALVMSLAPSFSRIRLAPLGLLATAAILLVWPWPVARYMTPILPWLMLLLLIGIQRMGEELGHRIEKIAVPVFVLVVTTTGAAQTVSRIAEVSGCNRSQAFPDAQCLRQDEASFFNLVRFVNDSVAPNARILAAKGTPLFYYTNRTSIPAMYLTGMDSVHFWSELRAIGVRYITLGALHSNEWHRLADHLARRCTDLRLVAAFPPRTYLFLVDTTSSALRDSATRDPRACMMIRQYQAERRRHL